MLDRIDDPIISEVSRDRPGKSEGGASCERILRVTTYFG
jgi:hypothetical protein